MLVSFEKMHLKCANMQIGRSANSLDLKFSIKIGKIKCCQIYRFDDEYDETGTELSIRAKLKI